MRLRTKDLHFHARLEAYRRCRAMEGWRNFSISVGGIAKAAIADSVLGSDGSRPSADMESAEVEAVIAEVTPSQWRKARGIARAELRDEISRRRRLGELREGQGFIAP